MAEQLHNVPDEISFAGWFRAIVTNNVDPKGEGRIYVTIPKFQPEQDFGAEPTKKDDKAKINKDQVDNKNSNTVDDSVLKPNGFLARPCHILNSSPTEKTVTNNVKKGGGYQDVKIDTSLKNTNYNPMSGNYSVPRIGTWVYVFFEDEDPKKCYWLPFGPTLEGEVVPFKNVESLVNKNMPSKMVNIDVIKELFNGNVIYFDANEDKNHFEIKFDNGHRIKIEHNNLSSCIVLDTESGHQIKIVDRSCIGTLENIKDANTEDGIPFGSFIKIETKKGNIVLLDDNAGNEKIDLITQGGHKINMDDTSETITITNSPGHTIVMNPTGIYLN
jgi:hypothetical protein